MPSKIILSQEFHYPEFSKVLGSLLCKVRSLTRVLFDIEAYYLAWDEYLKKMDGEALTLGDVRTFYFLAVGFLVVAFLVVAFFA